MLRIRNTSYIIHFKGAIDMEFSERVKYLRQKREKTLDEVAKIVGVSNATVSRWENGHIENVRIDKLLPLAKALNTSVAYLIGAVDNPDEDSFATLSVELAIMEDNQRQEIKKAEDNLLRAAREVYGNNNGVSGSEILTPDKINSITNFIRRNADMLRASMPKASEEQLSRVVEGRIDARRIINTDKKQTPNE
jgi:transcriptional regulator with XRE-family HTH domain